MPKIKLKLNLESTASRGAPTSAMLVIPSATLGMKARVPVKGTINGFPFRSSFFPTGKGMHYMVVNKEVRAGAKATVGEIVTVVMEVDTEPRVVTLAADLKKALAKNKTAKAALERLAYSHQKEYVGYIEEAKRPETRAKRIKQTLEVLSGVGKKADNG
ncbi:MAG: YdeI/OmpD-associated family protein [Chloroflexota bacterium]